jgi:ribosomal protein S27AE
MKDTMWIPPEEYTPSGLNKPRCVRCGSGFVYTTKDGLVCRRCGYRGKAGYVKEASK